MGPNKALHLTPRAAALPGERSREFMRGKVNFAKATVPLGQVSFVVELNRFAEPVV